MGEEKEEQFMSYLEGTWTSKGRKTKEKAGASAPLGMTIAVVTLRLADTCGYG
jgi:hypothetical protein